MYMAIPKCTTGANDTGIHHLTDVFIIWLPRATCWPTAAPVRASSPSPWSCSRAGRRRATSTTRTSTSTAFLAAHDAAAAEAGIERMLGNTSLPYQSNLYSSAGHGFGTRTKVSESQGKFANEKALSQAVNVFVAF